MVTPRGKWKEWSVVWCWTGKGWHGWWAWFGLSAVRTRHQVFVESNLRLLCEGRISTALVVPEIGSRPLLLQRKCVRKHGSGINTTLWQVRKERCLAPGVGAAFVLAVLFTPWSPLGNPAVCKEGGAGGCSPITFTALILSLGGKSLQWSSWKCNSLQPKAALSNWFGLLFLWVCCSNNAGCWSSEGGFNQRAWALGSHFVAVRAHSLSEFPR